MFTTFFKFDKFSLKGLNILFHESSIRKLSNQKEFCLGLGSNVVDYIFAVKSLPKEGLKGYFKEGTPIPKARKAGGVVLNHLSWAAKMSVPCGLLARQGNDEDGKLLREYLKKVGVRTDFIDVSDDYQTGFSYIMVDQSGERSIVMNLGSTADLYSENVDNFIPLINKFACIVTCEISQVPLSGVIHILNAARESNCISILDVDVSPSIAVNEAKLGTKEEIKKAISLANVVKPAGHVVNELLNLYKHNTILPDNNVHTIALTKEISRELREYTNSDLLAITNGEMPSILSTSTLDVEVPTVKLDNIVDTTGAGDAFLAGLIKWIYDHGLPSTPSQLQSIGTLANQVAAQCVQTIGGVPDI